jgi:hypothetical protein
MPESVEANPADDEWHRPVHNSNVLTTVLLLDDNNQLCCQSLLRAAHMTGFQINLSWNPSIVLINTVGLMTGGPCGPIFLSRIRNIY